MKWITQWPNYPNKHNMTVNTPYINLQIIKALDRIFLHEL
jgi:hypothetical protein